MGSPALVLFNSMSKQKEVFVPLVDGQASMYVCGITPYDYSHIGHARAYVAFDVLYRYLKHLGYDVKYVRNFTDIDDKIIKRANESGEDPLSLSSRFSEAFLHDTAELNCVPPTHQPRVSDHIEQIKDLISKILENGCAYTIEGDVYFAIDNFPDYCQLSGRKLDDNRAGGGGRVSVDLRKKNPADFALWKAAKPGEPSWDSPWGPGRPGWHIECSAMSSQYLGTAFDIHGGGKDLIFPHHENELAQSKAACPEFKISHWMHNGFVNKDNQKMSKSDDNFFTIRDIIAKYHPLALRFFLMRTHYRADVNYSDIALENASDRIFYIYQTLEDCEKGLSRFREEELKGQIPAKVKESIDKFHSSFIESMSDDLHTTAVLDDLMEPLKAINSNLKQLKVSPTPSHFIIILEETVKANVLKSARRRWAVTYRLGETQPIDSADFCFIRNSCQLIDQSTDNIHSIGQLIRQISVSCEKSAQLIDSVQSIGQSIWQVFVCCEKPTQLIEVFNRSVNRLIDWQCSIDSGKKPPKPVILSLLALEKEVRDVLAILGLLGASCSEILQQLKEKALVRAGLTEEQVQQLIEERNSARKNKEYAISDKIRKELSGKGIALMDEANGTMWRPCEPEKDDDAAGLPSNVSIES